MRTFFLTLSAIAMVGACSAVDTDETVNPVAVLETELGIIEIEVYPEKAPISSADFLHYVDEGYYDGQGFYRTVREDNDPREWGMSLIQGGRLDSEIVTGPIAHETTQVSGLTNGPGSVSIARDEPGTGSATFFFINVGNNDFLDFGGARNPDGQGYAVFGQVVSGMDVVKAIQAGHVKEESDHEATKGQYLVDPVIITKASCK